MNVCIIYKNIICDRIDVSEENDVNKTGSSKKCDVCHYLVFLKL